jgi:hypothetical protein
LFHQVIARGRTIAAYMMIAITNTSGYHNSENISPMPNPLRATNAPAINSIARGASTSSNSEMRITVPVMSSKRECSVRVRDEMVGRTMPKISAKSIHTR